MICELIVDIGATGKHTLELSIDVAFFNPSLSQNFGFLSPWGGGGESYILASLIVLTKGGKSEVFGIFRDAKGVYRLRRSSYFYIFLLHYKWIWSNWLVWFSGMLIYLGSRSIISVY